MRFWVLSFVMLIFGVLLLGGNDFSEVAAQDTQTIDPYPVPPDTTIPLDLVDFDKKGDVLKLTIVFKGTTADDYVPRPINIVILDKSQARNIQKFDYAEEQGIYVRKDISIRIEEEIENPSNGQKSIMFFNPGNASDHKDSSAHENATVTLRIDYTVVNVQEDSGLNIMPIVMVVLIVIVVVLLVGGVIFYFKRRSKDAKTFFSPETGPYYAFKSLLDDRIYYLDPDQYAKLYNSNSLDEYDYLGTATRIGGTIMPPDEEPFIQTPMMGKPLEATPIQQGESAVDLTNMQATPVAAPIGEIPPTGPDYEQYQEQSAQEQYPAQEPSQQVIDNEAQQFNNDPQGTTEDVPSQSQGIPPEDVVSSEDPGIQQ